MEFLEEEPRTRFLFHSRASSSTSEPEPQIINKRLAFLCASLSISLSLVSMFFIQSETLKYLVLWFALSFIVGPFAPTSITAGDIRVGHGKPVDPPPPDLDPSSEPDEPKKRRQRTRRPEEPITPINSNGSVINSVESERKIANLVEFEEEEKDWTDQDFDLLKKQMLKHPVGETGRWELIAEPFRGRHRVESVIKMGKSMAEKRPGSGDSFAQFLKQRKPMDRRLEAVSEDLGDEVKKESGWSSGEDIALLNALKVFPKEVSMRWEKIAAAVPGRSKAACMKRVADLKRDFRSSKASS